jgi:hypothetical protein
VARGQGLDLEAEVLELVSEVAVGGGTRRDRTLNRDREQIADEQDLFLGQVGNQHLVDMGARAEASMIAGTGVRDSSSGLMT